MDFGNSIENGDSVVTLEALLEVGELSFRQKFLTVVNN
jgi:hypothetical protein